MRDVGLSRSTSMDSSTQQYCNRCVFERSYKHIHTPLSTQKVQLYTCIYTEYTNIHPPSTYTLCYVIQHDMKHKTILPWHDSNTGQRPICMQYDITIIQACRPPPKMQLTDYRKNDVKQHFLTSQFTIKALVNLLYHPHSKGQKMLQLGLTLT